MIRRAEGSRVEIDESPQPASSSNAGSEALRQAYAARLRRQKTSEDVAQYVLQLLFNGTLRTGDRLDLDDIARSLGISRAPVREAVTQLERDGVIVTAYHRGSFIAPFNPETVREAFELYGILTSLAVSHVTKAQHPDTIAALDTVARSIRTRVGPEEVERHSREFRWIIHRDGASSRLRILLRSFNGVIPVSSGLILPNTWRLARAAVRKEFEAINSKDPHRAAATAFEIVQQTGNQVVRFLTEKGIFSSNREPIYSNPTHESAYGEALERLMSAELNAPNGRPS